MTAPHAKAGPAGDLRARTSDRHRVPMSLQQREGVYAELAKLWRDDDSERPQSFRHYGWMARFDDALLDYAFNLSRCFPLPRRTE
jgi:hypothetical protein